MGIGNFSLIALLVLAGVGVWSVMSSGAKKHSKGGFGANPTEGHPVTGSKIKQRAMKGVPMIIIDPREIELVPYAKYHLQLRPGTNVALLNMMSRFILDAGLVDRDFIEKRCEDWAAFETGLRALDLDELERITGVDRELARAAAIEYAGAEAAMSFHGLGVTEHNQGAKTVMLIANLAMMTGNVGRPGVGVNPLRGQNNVQGAADMGCQPHQGAGYLEVEDPEVHRHYEEFYGVELSEEQQEQAMNAQQYYHQQGFTHQPPLPQPQQTQQPPPACNPFDPFGS